MSQNKIKRYLLFFVGLFVNALGVKPDNALGMALLAKYGSHQVVMVGDCTARGGNYHRANHEAYNAAMEL